MCAIAGVLGENVDREVQHQLLQTMQRRGPDESGCYCTEGCCLIHSRLAIIDFQGGAQPMELKLYGSEYHIVYNGELYNTNQLRSHLRALGHSFISRSDTEVILHAYAQWGEKALELLNGIFAFAIWNETDKTLFLARDRIGVKPLFYQLNKQGITFASEIKTILSVPGTEAKINAEGVAQLLLLGPGRLPGSCVFSDIYEIRPGHYGVYKDGNLIVRQYWRLKDMTHNEDFQTTVQRVRTLVLDSIKRQMVSDVPVGTFLSGGLDSSIITAVCAKEYAGQGRRLQTFSVDYKDNDLHFIPNCFQPEADSQYIRTMSYHTATDHHWSVLRSEELFSALETAMIARDLPGMADVDSSMLLFCGRIRDHVKVALSGECADEIFGGYPWYTDPMIREYDGFPWSQNAVQRVKLLHPKISLNGNEYIQDAYLDTIRSADILPGTDPINRRMKEITYLNHTWFMQTLLDRTDRMSMHHGLEIRVPFCDYRIAQYLYTVPWEFKYQDGVEKKLLRMAVRDLLPQEILWRKKSPYPKTFDPVYTKLVEKRLMEILDDDQAPIHQIIHTEEVRNLLHEEGRWPWYGQLMRRPQTLGYFVQINLWMEHYRVQVCGY